MTKVDNIMKKFEIEYTEEMLKQDLLWRDESEDVEVMKKLQKEIINAAKNAGWTGFANQYVHENEAIVELYPSEEFYERAANGEAGYENNGEYTSRCDTLIKLLQLLIEMEDE